MGCLSEINAPIVIDGIDQPDIVGIHLRAVRRQVSKRKQRQNRFRDDFKVRLVAQAVGLCAKVGMSEDGDWLLWFLSKTPFWIYILAFVFAAQKGTKTTLPQFVAFMQGTVIGCTGVVLALDTYVEAYDDMVWTTASCAVSLTILSGVTRFAWKF